MIEELRLQGYGDRIFDIYDYLADEEIFCDAAFWESVDPRLFYLKITSIRDKYENECNYTRKELLLRRLISCYLSIRDFYYAKYFLSEYEFTFGKDMNSCIVEIDQLIESIRQMLSKANNKHIVMFWLDQLRYRDVDRMPYLKKFSTDNISFENCYTQNLQTSTTFKMMFSSKDVLDGKAYDIETINENNSTVYNELINHGYDFKYIGWGKNNVYFDGISSYSLDKDNCILPLNIWKVIMDILDNEKNTFYLSHSFETHEHHFCGLMTKSLYDIWDATYEEFVYRYYECVDYIDKQLEFYLDWFGNNTSLIVMSDHGQELENVYLFDEDCNINHKKFKYGRWSEGSLHTVMCVKNLKLGCKRIQGMFSLVQFIEIVHSIIEQKWLVQEKEYVKLQSMPFYSEDGIRKIINAGDLKFAMLVKGVITRKAKYLKYAHGEEELYIDGDEDNNRLLEKKYKELATELRELTGEIDYSIFDNPKYSKAKDLLKKINLK